MRYTYFFGFCLPLLESSGRVFWAGLALPTLQAGRQKRKMPQAMEMTCIQYEDVSGGGHGLSFSLPFPSYVRQLLIVGCVFESQSLLSV